MVRGQITKQNTRNWQGKTFHSILVDETWYSLGTKRPPADGTYVEFGAEQNDKGYWNVDKGGLRVIEAGAPARNVAAGAVKGAKFITKDDYWSRREERDIEVQKRIELQSCRNSAIELIGIMLKAEAIKLPAIAKREEFLAELVTHYTDEFKAQNSGSAATTKQEEAQSTEQSDEAPTDESGWD